MDEETRIKALAEFLELEPEDIVHEYGNTFAVSPHEVRRGTSPSEARRLIDQLRDILRDVIGPETDQWTTETFYKEQHEYKAAKERAEQLEREIERLQRELPQIKSPYTVCKNPQCKYQSWKYGPSKCPKCKGELLRMGTRRPIRTADLEKCEASLRAQVEPQLRQIDMHKQKLDHERNEYLGRFIYQHIINVIKLKQPEALEIGLHEVANTLHFLMPQRTKDHAEEHRKTLQEAFDGRQVMDRTRFEPTNAGEYLVLTDSEADQAQDDSFESYLDDCVLPDLPEQAQKYFDRDAWKEDAKQDGRGHAISGYDGEEREVMAEGEWLYIYRIN